MMATITNQGTLLYTPAGGTQVSLNSNTTSTELDITYGLDVRHGVTPSTYTPGDTVLYTVLLKNTGTGTLYAPQISVDLAGGALSYTEGSAVAFQSGTNDVVPIPVTVTPNGSGVIFGFNTTLPEGGLIYLNYNATVAAGSTGNLVSTATGTANEGSVTGTATSDSDTATITLTLLSLTKTAPASANVGDTISYVFTMRNNSTGAIAMDRLSDQLPANFTFGSVTLTVGGTPVALTEGTDYSVTTGNLFTLSPAAAVSIPAGGNAILTVTGTITA